MAVACLAAACGGSGAPPIIATTTVQQAIENTIFNTDGIQTKVTCPRRVPEKAAYRFTCYAALTVGAYPMYVVEQAAHRALAYSNPSPLRILDPLKIERAIQAAVKRRHRHRRKLAVTASCPQPVLQSAGLMFTCTASFTGGPSAFTVTETDALGHVKIVGG